MMHNAGCWKLQRAVLVIATSLLSACATASSEADGAGTCPPVMAYDAEFQARAAAEVQALPDGLAIVEMLSDYAVMREQARACTIKRP